VCSNLAPFVPLRLTGHRPCTMHNHNTVCRASFARYGEELIAVQIFGCVKANQTRQISNTAGQRWPSGCLPLHFAACGFRRCHLSLPTRTHAGRMRPSVVGEASDAGLAAPHLR